MKICTFRIISSDCFHVTTQEILSQYMDVDDFVPTDSNTQVDKSMYKHLYVAT